MKNQLITRELLIKYGFKETYRTDSLTFEINKDFEIDCAISVGVFKGVIGTKNYWHIIGNDKQGICFYFEDYTIEMLDGLIYGLTQKHLIIE
jgi:hypothetical protein